MKLSEVVPGRRYILVDGTGNYPFVAKQVVIGGRGFLSTQSANFVTGKIDFGKGPREWHCYSFDGNVPSLIPSWKSWLKPRK